MTRPESTPVRSGWQPIATVPVGVEVLIAIPYPSGTWGLHVDEVDEDGEWMIHEGEATFWHPLPPLPTRAQGGPEHG